MMPTRRHAASLGHRNTLSQRRSHPPLQERVYRALLKLPADGKIIKHPPTGRTVTWSAARGQGRLFNPGGVQSHRSAWNCM